ncbi:MAG: chromate efflux transporter [Magnetovibrionaceae bacterium]
MASVPVQPSGSASSPDTPSFAELFKLWLRVGLISFGGPAGQIALMQRLLVDEKKWLSENRFLHALSFCMLLPGPEAMQLATYSGWLTHGVRGGIVAGLLFVLPGAFIVVALALLYVEFGDIEAVAIAFVGIKAAVLAIVLAALMKIGKKALLGWGQRILALSTFAGLFLFDLPFPVIIALAALAGAIWFKPKAAPDDLLDEAVVPPSLGRTGATVAIGAAIWFLPLIALSLIFAETSLARDLSLFFSKLAVVTFGGAYAVLAYMTQQVVDSYAWMSTAQMVDGLGLAETTPGPLILVNAFVAFLAGFQADGGGLAMAFLGAFIALWATFAPCFLWIFAAAPYVEHMRGMPTLAGALAGISAGVVGVILNLAVWFGLVVIFGAIGAVDLAGLSLPWPDWAGLDPLAFGLAILAAYLLLGRKWGVIRLLVLTASLALGAWVLGWG